jgi:hypothetical protein
VDARWTTSFQRHADYWDKDHPYLDEVVIKPYNDQAAMLIALQSGGINAAIGVPYKDAKRLSSELQIVARPAWRDLVHPVRKLAQAAVRQSKAAQGAAVRGQSPNRSSTTCSSGTASGLRSVA